MIKSGTLSKMGRGSIFSNMSQFDLEILKTHGMGPKFSKISESIYDKIYDI